MDDALPLLVIFGGFAAVLAALAWLARRVRRRGTGGAALAGALAAWEEAYRITSHEAHVEIQAQADRQSPALSPDGPWTSRGRGGRDARGGRGEWGGRGRGGLARRARRPGAAPRRPTHRRRPRR
ncbi:hypothetical protein AB0C93_16405 [Streptomyces sp. NPDC048518]|uniref:hypothetical protein n=1 Tax=Streptomyces sp. NPDC048518 TaxID=3155029 RepID=UPI0033ED1A91